MKLLLLLTNEDKPYLSKLSGLLGTNRASCYWGKLDTLGQLDILCRRAGTQAIVTTRQDVVALDTPKAKISNFMGGIIDTPLGHEMLVIPPVKWLIRVPYGEWLIGRYLSKLLSPDSWYKASPFTYTPLTEEHQFQEFQTKFDDAIACAIDIETIPPNYIQSISYTLKFPDSRTETACFLLNSFRHVEWMRLLNAHPVPKICQNGKYECAHFYAWSAPMTNYIGDTLSAMHSTWSELPKDLGFVGSMFLRKYRYWKDMRKVGEAGDTDTLLEYNAMDTWGTCESFFAWLLSAPEYAVKNYVLKWPQIIISHEMEMRGLKRDELRKARWKRVFQARLDKKISSVQAMIGVPEFNPNSPKQVGALLHALTGKNWDSGDEKTIKKIELLHPLNERILETLLECREDSKLIGTYLGDKDYEGRWLYSINPTGTDTGRDSSKAHHFWCGQNVQNVPAESWEIKNTVIADEGYELYEADNSQAEARGVAYCSGDSKLLEVVNGPHDFHSMNASLFFGVKYEEIYDDERHKKLNIPLRNLAKRVNHGANYNMGEQVLIDTMGPKKIREAQRLLKLPASWTLKQVSAHLLTTFELTYSRIKTRYYKWIVSQVRLTHKLVGAHGWTRYCFAEPWENKPALNSYVAHVTQSLNAINLDEAALRVFKWRLATGHMKDVRINAKIHDSLLFQVPIGRKDLAEKVRTLMEFPVQVTDCAGVTRQMLVPVDLKYQGKRWELFQ